MIVALILAAAAGSLPQSAERFTPGFVLLVGEGAVLDAATCGEIAADRRLVLGIGPPGNAPDPCGPLAAGGTPAERIVLDPAADHAGDAVEPAERVRRASCVVLTGGGTMDWFALLTPGGGTTRLSEAIRQAHGAGVAVVGAGAAAPFLAEWSMVERAAIQKPQRNPQRLRENVPVEGLGLIENLLVDSSACTGGGAARTMRAAFENHVRNVVFLDGPVTWIGDPRQRSARVRGNGTAIVLDLARCRRQRDAWREGRLSFLSEGDAWSARHGAACAEPARPRAVGEIDPREEPLRASLERASARLLLRSDEFTHVGRASEGGRASTCGLCFDLEWPAWNAR